MPEMFFVLFVWITLCLAAVFLAVLARRQPFLFGGQAFYLWFGSMFVLDGAAILVALTDGYNQPFFLFIMLVLIQWVYIGTAVGVYRKSKTEGNQFDEVEVRGSIYSAPIGPAAIGTLLVAHSFGAPFETALISVFVVAGLLWLLDRFLIRASFKTR